MNSAKILFGRAALVAVAVGLATGALTVQAAAQMPQHLRPGQTVTIPGVGPKVSNFGFFPANEPAASNRVGVFVARRSEGVTSLYYCSMPADPGANGASVCKQIKGFPAD